MPVIELVEISAATSGIKTGLADLLNRAYARTAIHGFTKEPHG